MKKKTGHFDEVKYAHTLRIGEERVKKLTDCAIEASYLCGRQYTAAQFNIFLIDNFAEAAKRLLANS